jgi:hypothetical protein
MMIISTQLSHQTPMTVRMTKRMIAARLTIKKSMIKVEVINKTRMITKKTIRLSQVQEETTITQNKTIQRVIKMRPPEMTAVQKTILLSHPPEIALLKEIPAVAVTLQVIKRRILRALEIIIHPQQAQMVAKHLIHLKLVMIAKMPQDRVIQRKLEETTVQNKLTQVKTVPRVEILQQVRIQLIARLTKILPVELAPVAAVTPLRTASQKACTQRT